MSGSLNSEELSDQTSDGAFTLLATQCQPTDSALGENAPRHSISQE